MDFTGKVPEIDPRPGLNGKKGSLFRTTIECWKLCKELNQSCHYFIENVVFNDMTQDWEEVCRALGQPTIVDAKNHSRTCRWRAYWSNFPIPTEALVPKPMTDWDTCMDHGRTLRTVKRYGRQVVPTLGKSWKIGRAHV